MANRQQGRLLQPRKVGPCILSSLTLLAVCVFHVPDVTKLNAAISTNTELQGKSLDEIMATAMGGVFNNAAQVSCVCVHSIDVSEDRR